MRRTAVALAVALAAVGGTAACGGREAPDDSAFHQDVLDGRNGAEVTFDALVLTNPVLAGGHERFVVRASTGERLEVDHNTTLARYVPLHIDSAVVIHGELYIDPGPKLGVHCTHSVTSSGCPNPGWIMYGGSYYE